jgi:hypothetical protein
MGNPVPGVGASMKTYAAPRFSVGSRVTVLDLQKPGHIRTPDYVVGRTGVVIQFCGLFLNPEELSIGNVGGPAIPLYRVRFERHHLWSDETGLCKQVAVCIELYEHWLDQAKPENGD